MQATNKNKKSIFRYGWYLILVANIAAILVLFLSTLAWTISPSKTTIFAYLGLGFIFILAVNIIFLLFWIVCLKWKFALVPFVSLLLFSSAICTYFPIHFQSKEIPENSIKVLSYNIRGFSWYADKNDKDNETIMYIKNSGADIICLQEFMLLEHSKSITSQKVKNALKEYPYYSFVRLKSIYNGPGYLYGLACFSKYPIISTTEIPIDTKENAGSVMHKIKINDKIISVFNNHLESNRLTSEDRKLYQKLIEGTDRQRLDDVAHNLRKRLGVAYVKRAPQADLISSWIKEEEPKSDGVIVCGDFNDTPISYTYKTIKGDLGDSFAETGFGAGITYNENYFWFRIDYIMHSKNFKAYNCTIDKVKYSDHYPIWVYLEME